MSKDNAIVTTGQVVSDDTKPVKVAPKALPFSGSGRQYFAPGGEDPGEALAAAALDIQERSRMYKERIEKRYAKEPKAVRELRHFGRLAFDVLTDDTDLFK